jgi:hypothetical protein
VLRAIKEVLPDFKQHVLSSINNNLRLRMPERLALHRTLLSKWITLKTSRALLRMRLQPSISKAENRYVPFYALPSDMLKLAFLISQLSIFTCCVWLGANVSQSIALISDCTNHTKFSVHVCLKKIVNHVIRTWPEVRSISFYRYVM